MFARANFSCSAELHAQCNKIAIPTPIEICATGELLNQIQCFASAPPNLWCSQFCSCIMKKHYTILQNSNICVIGWLFLKMHLDCCTCTFVNFVFRFVVCSPKLGGGPKQSSSPKAFLNQTEFYDGGILMNFEDLKI